MKLNEIEVSDSVVPVFEEQLTELEHEKKYGTVAQEAQAIFDEREAKAAARQSALAKLAELGLTEEEIQAL